MWAIPPRAPKRKPSSRKRRREHRRAFRRCGAALVHHPRLSPLPRRSGARSARDVVAPGAASTGRRPGAGADAARRARPGRRVCANQRKFGGAVAADPRARRPRRGRTAVRARRPGAGAAAGDFPDAPPVRTGAPDPGACTAGGPQRGCGGRARTRGLAGTVSRRRGNRRTEVRRGAGNAGRTRGNPGRRRLRRPLAPLRAISSPSPRGAGRSACTSSAWSMRRRGGCSCCACWENAGSTARPRRR